MKGTHKTYVHMRAELTSVGVMPAGRPGRWHPPACLWASLLSPSSCQSPGPLWPCPLWSVVWGQALEAGRHAPRDVDMTCQAAWASNHSSGAFILSSDWVAKPSRKPGQ